MQHNIAFCAVITSVKYMKRVRTLNHETWWTTAAFSLFDAEIKPKQKSVDRHSTWTIQSQLTKHSLPSQLSLEWVDDSKLFSFSVQYIQVEFNFCSVENFFLYLFTIKIARAKHTAALRRTPTKVTLTT